MKKIFFLMVLLISINGKTFAQEKTNTDKIFDLPENSIRRKFIIDLDKGNKMQIELTNINELDYLNNIDSIVQTFVHDIAPLKDSLMDELVSKKIDYIIDSNSFKQIRIQKFQPAGSSFIVKNGEASSLKLEQDTITLLGKIPGLVNGILFSKQKGFHYYRVSFFLNNLNDLAGYMDGMLNEKIKTLKESTTRRWEKSSEGVMHPKNNTGISSAAPNGYLGGGDMLSLRASIDVQNYKNYFVPSVTLGASIIINNNLVRHEFGVTGESHFFFSKNAAGKLNTYRNTFLTISYGRGTLRDNEVKKNGNLYPWLSFGYLIKGRGDFYDKNTFKLGLGRWSFLGGLTRIEPTIYFNNFFKGVTPSLRITQSF